MDVEEETREEKFWREFWADLPVKNQSRPLSGSQSLPVGLPRIWPPNVVSFEVWIG